MLIGMGLLHFDDLIKFISKTITVGFTLGIAVGIIVGAVCLQWIFRDWMLLKRSLANVNEQPYHIMEKASFIDRVGADTTFVLILMSL